MGLYEPFGVERAKTQGIRQDAATSVHTRGEGTIQVEEKKYFELYFRSRIYDVWLQITCEGSKWRSQGQFPNL